MFVINRYTEEKQREWNLFVAKSKNGTFLFDRNYMDYHKVRFCDYSLMIYKYDKLYALFPANEDNGTLVTHGGLTYGGLITNIYSRADDILILFKELNIYLKQNNIHNVIYKAIPWIYHRIPSEEDLYALFKECSANLIKRDISSVIIPRRPLKWSRDRKYGVKKANANNIIVGQSDDFKSFWRVLTDNLQDKYGVAPVHSLEEILLLKSRFPHNILLYTATIDDEVLGGTVLYVTPQVIHSQYISASKMGKKLRVIDAVYDRILNYDFVDYPYFDFGKSTECGGHILNESLIYQKEGFGGRGVCYDTYEWKL